MDRVAKCIYQHLDCADYLYNTLFLDTSEAFDDTIWALVYNILNTTPLRVGLLKKANEIPIVHSDTTYHYCL
ncbi:hypothetical protein [Ulvibacter litoralis]|uniref:Uncharacterized protein n=2 Tax=Ulvibacter litoralis TaxID=227084 RepID=A0A1G7CMH4_9FLAO|nr:hypothetical protein [Ulvibacter litoralis]GHC46812.1 hypothetical protein GCM10008083_07370 [Ulvibacter litoralis]SDE40441.1 hypothetical protein SAMN05421855_101460 [Ulvibacter litoralis]